MADFLQTPCFVWFEVLIENVVSGEDTIILAHPGESDAGRCEKWKINSTLASRLPLLSVQSGSFSVRRVVLRLPAPVSSPWKAALLLEWTPLEGPPPAGKNCCLICRLSVTFSLQSVPGLNRCRRWLLACKPLRIVCFGCSWLIMSFFVVDTDSSKVHG
jgi:hypothetical protein